MSEQIRNLLMTLRDFVPELHDYSIEELYNYWEQWMSNWHQGRLQDFISNKQKVWESK